MLLHPFTPRFSTALVLMGLVLLPVFSWLFWSWTHTPPTLTTLTDSYQQAGTEVRQDLATLAPQTITEEDQTYTITDTTSDGIDISFANETEPTLAEGESEDKASLTLSFPKDYSQPIEVKLDDKRTITITDLGGKSDYQSSTLSHTDTEFGSPASTPEGMPQPSLWQRILQFGSLASKKEETPRSYLRYTSKDQRKELLYAYQKDQATGEKKLKHWTLYQAGNGLEQESYQIENAKIKITEEGRAEVFYYGQEEQQQDLKNDQAAGEVDSNLLERAQRTLAKEMGDDLLNGNHTPDLTIPKPYYIDKEGNRHDAEWKWNEETKTLSVSFTPESYPVALDPTLSFTAPGVSNSGSVITGEAASDSFGTSLTTGDFNVDGKTDLAVGAAFYSTNTGRAYIFYNDGSLSTMATTADVIITGEATNNYFGSSLAAGDWNADGKTDLVVGASWYSTNTGRAYIFHNDGTIPITAATADVIITGEASSSFGDNGGLAAADFNADGRTDLAVGAYSYSSQTGRTYIFYNDGSIPTTAATADAVISGETSDTAFGVSLATGDLNSDGKMDLAVGAHWYGAGDEGRVYIFYSGSIITENASGADVIISHTGSNQNLGYYLTTGDFNADGRTDLAAASNTGIHIFYNDGSIPTTTATADLTITGATGFLMAGDMNMDGRTDLIAASSSIGGIVYVFYNDSSIPTTAAAADVSITGEVFFGTSLAVGDLNSDGKTDLIVGSRAYASSRGRAYIFYSQNGQVNTNQSITGEVSNNGFGSSLVTGDFNADGRTDLAVGAYSYSSNAGRTYVFYGDGQIPSTAATADAIITGEASSQFGYSLTSGDFNADGKTDLAVGAILASTAAGRAYIFYNGSIITEAATGADIIITGEASSQFGYSLAAGDWNADGETDLVVGAIYYSTTGRAYIFYNGSIITEAATGADIIITGEASSQFGYSLAAGDWNADGETDLAAGAVTASTNAGRAYIFYNGSIVTEAASGADIILTGEASSYFGYSFSAGDFNADGKTDLAVGAAYYSTDAGRAYIFYNGSIITEAATGADIIISGAAGSYFGFWLTSGDFNADGKTDLGVGAVGTNSVYLFYNGSIITEAATGADISIAGPAGSNFGYALTSGDLNADGRTDLIVGASGSNNTVYFYETRENFAWEIQEQFGGTSRTGVNGTGQELQIVGETGSYFGVAMTSGDWNADGKTDLAVGANNYSTNTGRVYVFYGDGSLTVGASSADVILSGEATSSQFGASLAAGDYNADGKIDLAVGASGYSTSTGRAYIFYNGSIVSENATGADVILTGEAASDSFGSSLAAGDLNADGWTDLAVGASGYSTNTGRAYIFYNGSIITEAASGADVIITGETLSNFFSRLTVGDLNADGKVDLVVGAYTYSGGVGRAYIFYNGSIITENASGADIKITGEAGSNFSTSLAAGDYNADGKTDLAVGASGYSTNTGRAYIFYNGSIITEAATGADIILTGETTSNQFGYSLAAGDWNADGKTDLAVGARLYSTNTGRAYIFYNGSIITENASGADVILTGEATSSQFGASLASGDYNADGKTDLAVGAYAYSSNKGKVYLYTWNDPIITGEATNDYFGYALTSGDFNADGKTDLAVGAHGYSTTGRAYIFYSGSIVSENASGADVIITGEASSSLGTVLTSGDWNADGKTDLAVSTYSHSSFTGRTYLFYNGSIVTENASGADIIITGEASSYFGYSLGAGDFNADGKIDLAVGAYNYSSAAGRTYIFYNGSIITEAATGADVIITGEAGSYFGTSLAAGDYNADGETDLAVSAAVYSSSAGRTYLFYNDGSIPTTAATADVIITGEASSYFGWSLLSGDWNVDGKTDLAVGANLYITNTGRVYVFYNDGSIPTTAATADIVLTGETTSNYFGTSLAAVDYNADGKTDLAVGAQGYSADTGRAYVFYNGSIVSEAATGADVIITGVSSSQFGYFLIPGDWNADGKTDLAVGAHVYSTSTGRVYLYTSEVSAASILEDVSAKVRGTVKTRGTIKVR